MKNDKVVKQKLKSSSGEFFIYRFLSMKCRSVYNMALANIKKHYKEEKKYINKFDNFTELQHKELSLWLNNEIYQKAVFSADTSYQSYFELLKYQKENHLEITAKEPDYIKGYFPITFSYVGNKYENGKRVFNIPMSVSFKRFLREIAPDINYLKQFVDVRKLDLPDNYFIKLSIPKILTDKKIKEVSIIPLYNGKKFEIAYTYLDDKEYKKASGSGVMSIDLGINNLATCVTDKWKPFIIDGKRIKRGLYETKDKRYINADLNGALNIYRKSSVCDMKVISNLIRRGVSTPKRLQVI